MSKRRGYYSNIAKVGNFTKHAVESFEENIINKKDYLEQVENDLNNK